MWFIREFMEISLNLTLVKKNWIYNIREFKFKLIEKPHFQIGIQ